MKRLLRSCVAAASSVIAVVTSKTSAMSTAAVTMCAECGQHPAKEGLSYCESCVAKTEAAYRAAEEDRRWDEFWADIETRQRNREFLAREIKKRDLELFWNEECSAPSTSRAA